MLKKLKIKNSTILLVGIVIILLGVILGFYDYFMEKKNKAFSDMNIMLYENELPENIDDDSEIEQKIEENPIEEPEPEKPQNQETKYNYIGILEIPKIGLKRGFLDINSRYNNVDYNITVINGSTFPDEKNNNLILASHSGLCSICFFHNLYKLSVNDVAYVYYKNIKYNYKVTNIYEVEKTGKVAIYRDNSKNTLTLITCTRNSDTRQTVYILELTDKENY